MSMYWYLMDIFRSNFVGSGLSTTLFFRFVKYLPCRIVVVYWPPVCSVWPNHDVVDFQLRSVNTLNLCSVAYCCVPILMSPFPPLPPSDFPQRYIPPLALSDDTTCRASAWDHPPTWALAVSFLSYQNRVVSPRRFFRSTIYNMWMVFLDLVDLLLCLFCFFHALLEYIIFFSDLLLLFCSFFGGLSFLVFVSDGVVLGG